MGQSMGWRWWSRWEPLKSKAPDVKKPACGRLLVGNLGLFLVNRNHLQKVHPQGTLIWNPEHSCRAPGQASVLSGRCRKWRTGYWHSPLKPSPETLCHLKTGPRQRLVIKGLRGLRVDHQKIQPRIRRGCRAICSALKDSSGYSWLLWLRRRRPPLGSRYR